MHTLRLLAVALLAAAGAVAGADDKDLPLKGSLQSADPRFDQLFPKGAQLEKLAGGFKWTEGPAWIKDGGYLVFSDIPNNTVNKWQPGKGLTKDFIKPSG